MKNIKKLIAVLLITTMFYPKIIVQGDNGGQIDINIKPQQENYSDIIEEKEEGIEERTEVKEEESATEDIIKEENETENESVKVDVEEKSIDKLRGTNYNTYEASEIIPKTYFDDNEGEYVSEEVIEKREAILEYKLLSKITDSPYEIALSHKTGGYSFWGQANSIEEAIGVVDTLGEEYDNEEIIPVVVNDIGQIVYSTNSMGRMWQHRDGKPQGSAVDITKIYPDATMKNEYTYISMDSIDDAPVIEDNGRSAKVRVNGYDGWINRNEESENYEMVVIPLNKVTNPSHYYAVEGKLYHYISYNSEGSYGSGHNIAIGIAPDFMKQGVKYYSYDGMYFYQGTSDFDGLNKLIMDLRRGTTTNAINGNTPFYNYYQYLPFRTRTNYTAADLDKFINENTKEHSKLRGLGQVFIESYEKYGVNPLIALGVAINESAWGTSTISQEKNNLFGMNAVDKTPNESANYFQNPGDSVKEFTQHYISKGYANPGEWRYYGGYLGNKKFGANVKYASDPYWGEKAAQHALTVDLYLSGGNIQNLKDYNGYQLAVYQESTAVRDVNQNVLYNINPTVVTTGNGGFVGNMVALKFSQPSSSGNYQIFTERITPLTNGSYDGIYNWNNNGYVNRTSLKFVNIPNTVFIPGYAKEDTDKNGVTDYLDVENASWQYNNNSTSSEFKPYMDLNGDGIIDIYDYVLISGKTK